MTQVIPREDDFAVGPGARGTTLSLWVRMRPWTTDAGYASGGTEYTNLTFWNDEVRMQDGFSRDLPDDGAGTIGMGRQEVAARDLLSGRSAGFCETTTTNVWPRMGGAFFRNAVAENLDVEALFGHVGNVDLASGSNDYVRFCGVAARLQDGSVTSGGDQDRECVTNQIGYFFVRAQAESVSPNGGKYFLLRSDGSGGFDRLADYPSGNGTVLSPTVLRAGLAQRLRIKVITDGSGDAVITCWAGRTTDSDTPVLTYTDSSGDKITGDGRTGFFASFEWYAATGQNGACVCSWVQAKNVTSGALLYRDEFLRNVGLNRQPVANVGKVAIVPAENYEGFSLLQAFYHDLGGHTDSTVGPGTAWGQLVYTGDNILIDDSNLNSDVAPELWAPSQFKAESDQTARIVEFQFQAVGTAGAVNREFRVLARESGTLDFPNFHYELAFQIDDLTPSTTGTAILRRYVFGVPKVLGTASVTLAETTTYEVELRTRNIDTGPSLVSDTVEIKAYIGGVQIVLVEDATVPTGVSADSSGTFFDESTRRLSSQRGEGIGALLPSGTGGIIVESWALGVADVPEEVEADRVSITVTAEGASPVGTLVIPAGWSLVKISPSAQEVRDHRFESGHFRTEARQSKYRPRWQLSGVVARNALGTLEAFWHNHKGGEIPFNWTDPQGIAHVGRFSGGFTKSKLSPAAWSFTTVIEALNE